jgi:MFS family permease
MALSRTTRVNLLIGNGHFLSHFYVLCLPPLFLVWQKAFDVSFAELGLTVALMSGTTAVLQTPVGFLVDRYGARRFLVGGALLMSLSMATMGLATSYWQIPALATLSGIGNSVFHPCDYAIISGSVDRDRMGRSFALHSFSGNLGFASGPPVMALLAVMMGWRASLVLVGLLGVPVVAAILLQSSILKDQARQEPHHAGEAIGGRALLFSRTMLLFFGFYLLGSMAGSGVQAWLITVLHTVNGMELAIASTALTGYMAGSTCGVLAGGWFADAYRQHVSGFAVGLTAVSAALVLAVALLGMPSSGRQPHAARRDAEGRVASGTDRQGVRLRQRRVAAGQRADAGAVRDADRPAPSRAGFDPRCRAAAGEPVVHGERAGLGAIGCGGCGGGIGGRVSVRCASHRARGLPSCHENIPLPESIP